MTSQVQLADTPRGAAASAAACKQSICAEMARCCAEQFGSSIRALVLTGSLARNEATFVATDAGVTMLGDADFLLVLDDRSAVPSDTGLESLCRRAESALSSQGVQCHITLSAGHSSYLAAMRPHIFAYELRACGEVVWGDRAILSVIPPFSPADIPLEDAWRLLCNRIVEQLEAAAVTLERPEDSAGVLWYRTAKLYADMATSYLLFAGEYVPSYRERAAKLLALARTGSNADAGPLSQPGFAERVAACTDWKLAPVEHAVRPELREQAVADARRLWRWELRRLTGAGEDLSDRDLLRLWMGRQPLRMRLRGWLFVLRAQGWLRSWRQWPRWLRLAAATSPRYAVYAAASALFFQAPWTAGPDAVDAAGAAEASRWVPVRDAEQANEVVAWKRLARQAAWNYHRFLEGTRA